MQSDLKPEPGRRGSARRASSVDYEVKHDKAVRQAIQKHVFPHILAGVAQYKGVLSSVDRNCIGKKVRTQVSQSILIYALLLTWISLGRRGPREDSYIYAELP